ncbi:WhiB family transcriptional regulator [Streptomyces anthocyanicus]|uniref:WhiB family transcriptional regulator n=1 Tax=Streptomyces anthocyanicus TaxID=68174 RepID=UPI0038675FFE
MASSTRKVWPITSSVTGLTGDESHGHDESITRNPPPSHPSRGCGMSASRKGAAMNTNIPSLFPTTGAEPCAGQDIFFPDDYQNAVEVEEAKALCASCPILVTCRTWALAHPTLTTHGIWGGFTPQQRRRHRRLFPVRNDAYTATAA